MDNTRRDFVKKITVLGVGSTALTMNTVKANPKNILLDDRKGVLVDTTVCVGCRQCEWACKTSHHLPSADIETYKDRNIFNNFRRPDETAYTVVNEFENKKNPLLPINVKSQCMHCDHPACVSACIVGALQKMENGAVVWDTNKCIGCRYCMVACPFQIPAFEFLKPINPKICKCDFCYERQNEGKMTACAEICPVEALTFGTRLDLIKIAKNRIKRKPDNYIDHIFGEFEVGGTSWLYLSNKKFEEIGFPKVQSKTAPGVSEAIQHGIFAYFMPPIALYALLGTLMWITKKRDEKSEEEL